MKKWSQIFLSLVLVGVMTCPVQVLAAEPQKQQGSGVLKGIEQNGSVYTFPEACQTVYSLVVDPIEMLPRLAVFDGEGKECMSLDYRVGNASIDIFTPIDPAGTQKTCSTLDLETGASASQSSVYTYLPNGMTANQYDNVEEANSVVVYDKKGKMTSAYDGAYTYTYDAGGRLAKTEVEAAFVGNYLALKVIYEYTYNEINDVIKITEFEQYINGEMKVVGVTNFIY